MNNVSLSSPIDGSSIFVDTRSSLQSILDLTIHSFEAIVLAGTPPDIYPIWDSAYSLTHHSVSGGSDSICNSTIPPLSSLGFSFLVSSRGF